MPTKSEPEKIASQRILRLALGTALALWFSQAIAWPLSFIAPVFTTLLLAAPMPAPSLMGGVKFALTVIVSVLAGIILLPFLEHTRAVGILLVALALFLSFYYTASGGSMLLGTFITLGLTFVTTIGSVSIDTLFSLINGLTKGVIFALVFVWIAHALLPEPPPDPALHASAPPPKPDPKVARRNALRALLITLPMVLVFLFSSVSPSYTIAMFKVASLGQQASAVKSREMARSMLESTLWGGIGAAIAWQILNIWPSLLMYTLLIALAGLLFGVRIFKGSSMHPKSSMWSYALFTMVLILAPAVLNDKGADAAFYSRLFLFVVIAVYSSAAVTVFDAFWPSRFANRRD